MKQHSDQSPESIVNTGGAASPDLGAGGSRRRFIKGGAAAAPVILTFTSRPVLGFDNMCLSPSRMISGNHSGFAGPMTCNGTPLSDYQSKAASTGKPEPWFGDSFIEVFGTAYASKDGKVKDKLGEVLLDSYAGNDANPNSTGQFAAYMIAAYLNASASVGDVGTVLKPAQVIHMWIDVTGTTGQFCPQTAMCWNATGVIAYLQYSGIVPP